MSESDDHFVEFKRLKADFGVPYSRQHLSRMEAAGNFPHRVQISPRRVARSASEMSRWIEEKKALRYV